jgi:hypothetical protein
MREHRLENNGIESDDEFKREDAESEVADSDDADEEETFEEKVKNGQNFNKLVKRMR